MVSSPLCGTFEVGLMSTEITEPCRVCNSNTLLLVLTSSLPIQISGIVYSVTLPRVSVESPC